MEFEKFKRVRTVKRLMTLEDKVQLTADLSKSPLYSLL